MLKFFQEIFSRKNLLEEALEASWTMLEIDKKMFDASVTSLRRQDTAEVDIDIYMTDRKINQLEQDIRKKVLTHLAVSGPGDLTIGLTLVSLISDVERIGDYTKNIYELAKECPQRLLAGKWEEKLEGMEDTVSAGFGTLLEALRENDEEKAETLISDIAGVKQQCDKFVLLLIQAKDESFKVDEAVPLVLYMRYLKRISGHLQNVTSGIVNPFHRLKYMDERIPLVDDKSN